MPYFIAANAIPIIAFCTDHNQWFNGGLTKSSKVVIAAILVLLSRSREHPPRVDVRAATGP